MFIDIPPSQALANDFKYHFYFSAIVSYSKMFISARSGKTGILKLKELPILREQQWREVHNSIISVRNEFIAHNDGHAATAFLSWSSEHQIHFPQRLRKIYWNSKEAERVLALMKAIERTLSEQIAETVNQLNLDKNRNYIIENGQIRRLSLASNR